MKAEYKWVWPGKKVLYTLCNIVCSGLKSGAMQDGHIFEKTMYICIYIESGVCLSQNAVCTRVVNSSISKKMWPKWIGGQLDCG